MNFKRNNLDNALSPYLKQHKNNPIHWQEWSPEVLEYAKKNKKLIFVSVGYATCHWCHVMASDSFLDKEVAAFLNKHFVSMKVDREQRPDIDQYMMSFIIQTQGTGGWPLNVIMTPEQKPFLAVTYVSPKPMYGQPAFIDILHQAKDFYEKHKQKIQEFHLPIGKEETVSDVHLINKIQSQFDDVHAGFGYSTKFPPHNTSLFLLHYFERNKDIKEIIEKTLDVMALSGLHDHLQGGFYRYCVDVAWAIPHFEKMLYDQAMMLWVYSAAYKVLKKESYKKIAEKIIDCLEDTFEKNNLFYAAHDADTDHKEGDTYTWTIEELKKVLSKEEYSQFVDVYMISATGNFEGKNHFIKKQDMFLDKIDAMLLKVRKKKKQPFIDKKFITSWNALTGIALLMAYRYLGNKKAFDKAKRLFETLVKKHVNNGLISHSSVGNNIQKQGFLEDYATMLLFVTYMYEETGKYKELMKTWLKKLQGFHKKEQWYETINGDFKQVPAQSYDHPIPSSVSLAAYAVLRTNILLDKEYESFEYKEPLQFDFFNIAAFVSSGNIHLIETPQKIEWKKLPFNCMQKRSKSIKDCYQGRCMEFESVEKLISFIHKR